MNSPFSVRLAISSGEPAGIGPDLCILLSQHSFDANLIILGDPHLLIQRARLLNISVDIKIMESLQSPCDKQRAGCLNVFPVSLKSAVQAGKLDPANSSYVLTMLNQATVACIEGHCQGVVTAPVHKGVINDAGIKFTGHTEYLAELSGAPLPVMMLETEGLRIALVTTHLPLSDVPAAITPQRLSSVIEILHRDLVSRYDIKQPQIYVCGLNPHAGEGGHLGSEEQTVIAPVLAQLRLKGISLHGPLSADTIFSPENLNQADVFLTMYHDQGLPVLKFKGFGQAINVTLGLPIIRTSVDHGTALTLAGTGNADYSSFLLAIQAAIKLAGNVASH